MAAVEMGGKTWFYLKGWPVRDFSLIFFLSMHQILLLKMLPWGALLPNNLHFASEIPLDLLIFTYVNALSTPHFRRHL